MEGQEQVVETPSFDEASIVNMSSEELDKLISSPSLNENQSEGDDQQPQVAQPQQDNAVEKKSDDAVKQQPTDLESLKQQVTKMQEELELSKQRIAEKDQFIGKQGKEIGEYRKKLTPLNKDQLNEKFLTDPASALEEYNNHQRQIQEQEIFERQGMIDSTRSAVIQKVPEFNELIDDIVNIAKADGVPHEALISFKQNPFAIGETPGVLINLAERAKMARKMKSLEEEVGKLKSGKEQIVKKIEAAVNQPKIINANSGQAGSNFNVSESQLHALSDIDLDAAYKEVLRQLG
jgi:hypothetical protein